MTEQKPTIDPKTPTLISFAMCPFVQRSAITLKHKGIDFVRINIDLKNKPAWFLEIVPTGKVPALVLGDDVLFESSVINEFVDESGPNPLLPTDAMARAKERAWIVFAGNLVGVQYRVLVAKTEADYVAEEDVLVSGLLRLASESKGPAFAGARLSLLDTSIAPVFTRIALMPRLLARLRDDARAQEKLLPWMDHLLALPEVKTSVHDTFAPDFHEYFEGSLSFEAQPS